METKYVPPLRKTKPTAIFHPRTKMLLEKHHLVPLVRGGSNHQSNLFRLWEDKHFYWHRIFRDFSIHEICNIIHTKQSPYHQYGNTSMWKRIFGDRPIEEVETLLHRVLLRSDYRHRRRIDSI